jgi:hypothetical protein
MELRRSSKFERSPTYASSFAQDVKYVSISEHHSFARTLSYALTQFLYIYRQDFNNKSSFFQLKLRTLESDLEGHPTPRLNFVNVATGSLGQGLSVASGMAYFGKFIDKASYKFVLNFPTVSRKLIFGTNRRYLGVL